MAKKKTFDIEKESLALIDSHLSDWVLMAEEVFGVELDEEQKAVLRSIQHNPKTSIRSGTSRGKDFVSAVAAMCFMYSTPTWKANGEMDENTKVFLIAPSERQVEDIMFPEIARLFNRANARGFNLPGRLVGLGIRTDFREWFMTGFKADSHNVVAWTGLHAANIMFIVTEASGLAQLVFDGIEGNLHGYFRFVLAFNDNTGTGYAAESQRKSDWNSFTLDCLNAPNVKLHKEIAAGTVKNIPGQVDWEGVNDKVNNWCDIIDESQFKEEEGDFYWENENGYRCYRPNDLFLVKIRGRSPKASEGALVPAAWIEAANKRWKEMQVGNIITPSGIIGTPKHIATVTRPLRLGVDVAGMGRDNSSFCHRFGNYVDRFDKLHGGGKAVHMEVVGKTLNYMKEKTVPISGQTAQAFIDTIGEGAGVFSRLIELTDDQQIAKEFEWMKGRVHSCKFSQAAEWNEQPLKDMTQQYWFVNMRAYLYWAVRDWLDPKNKNDAALPEDPELFQELTETQWKFMSNGKVQIESKEDIKKRLKRSPDKGDSLANTFWPIADVDPNPKKRKDVSKFFH